MTSEFFSFLKQVYGSSGLPAAIADEKLKILWRNHPANTAVCLLDRDSLSFMAGDGSLVPGTVCITESETIHRFNVIKAKCPGDGETFYVAEHIGSDKLGSLLASPDIRAYMTYLCNRIRESASMISISADEIDNITSVLGNSGVGVTEQLNSINRSLMLILREVIDPEQLYYVLDPCCDDSIIYVSDEISRSAADAKKALGKKVKIVRLTDKNIFVRINRSVFETLLAEMTSECCRLDCSPEKLTFSCKKITPGKVLVKVESEVDPEKKRESDYSAEEKKGSRLYFNYLCEVLCSKYGASFTRSETEKGHCCAIELDTIHSDMSEVMSRPEYSVLHNIFNPMSVSLAEYHIENRYGSFGSEDPKQ